MSSIIQEYLKKINSRLHLFDLVIISVVTITFFGFSIFIYYENNIHKKDLKYLENIGEISANLSENQKIFASKNGATYTFSWCSAADRIKEENRIYFNNEEEAITSGRRLSKLCGKN